MSETARVSDAELEIIIANRMAHDTVRNIARELLALRKAGERDTDILMDAINETTALQEKLIACRTDEDFWLLQSQVKRQWDADVAATKATVEKAIARFQSSGQPPSGTEL